MDLLLCQHCASVLGVLGIRNSRGLPPPRGTKEVVLCSAGQSSEASTYLLLHVAGTSPERSKTESLAGASMATENDEDVDVTKFIDSWDYTISMALRDVIEGLVEEGFESNRISNVFSEDADGTPIFGFDVYRVAYLDLEKPLGVWLKFEPVHDTEPLKYWPLLVIHDPERGERASSTVFGRLIELKDRNALIQISRDLPSAMHWVRLWLEEAGYGGMRRGVKEWMPPEEGPSMGAPWTKEATKFSEIVHPDAERALRAIGRELENVGHFEVTGPEGGVYAPMWTILVWPTNKSVSHMISIFFPSNTDRPKLTIIDYTDGAVVLEEDLWNYAIPYAYPNVAGMVFDRVIMKAKNIAEVFRSVGPKPSVKYWRPTS